MSERDIFIAALQKEDPAERQAYLDEACAGKADLRRQVENLLRLHEDAGSFLEQPAAESAATGAFPEAAEQASSPEAPGAVIGPYKLIQQIGEGGMGAVWMAQQTEPVKRVVAIKLIKAGMDSRQVIARFEAERQALALMDHANIAKVLDAGTTERGRPYFVMDLVKGVPITRYCDEHHLTPRQRLELFIPVCHAIQHAHQKGVIHRDLKPSNVLVANYDGRPVPKVIDFGVAKAAGLQLTDKTLVTGFGNIVGTLEYMSPEQAEVNQLDIDTRSDIYSLGVLLYELLAGSPPFSHKELEKVGMLEMLRKIREDEPSKPSTKLSTADALPTLAANRGMEPGRLTRLVRGELDWIVMKALEKDRNRRYETANGFAMDVQRYLADEPVLAGPPSAWYRFRKFARRNRLQLALTSMIVLLLVGAAAFAWYLDHQAAEKRVEAERRDADERARLGRNAEAVGVLLDQCEQALRAERADRAAIALEAALRRSADGGAEEHADRLARCRDDQALLRELDAIDTYRLTLLAGRFPSDAAAAGRWRTAFTAYGVKPEVSSAAEAAKRVKESHIQDRLLMALDLWLCSDPSPGVRAVLRAADPDSFREAIRDAVVAKKGHTIRELAASAEALKQPARFAAVVGSLGAIPPEQRRVVLQAALRSRPTSLHLLLMMDNTYKVHSPEAMRWLQAAVAIHPENSAAHSNLGVALDEIGDLDGAIFEFQEAIRLDPQNVAVHLGNLGATLYKKGDHDAALAEYAKAIKLDPKLAFVLTNWGRALAKKNDLEGAIAKHKEAIQADPNFAVARVNLGRALEAKGDTKAAIAQYEIAIGLEPTEAAEPLTNWGVALWRQKDSDGALAKYEEAIRVDPNHALAHSNRGVVLWQKGQRDAGLAALSEAARVDPHSGHAHGQLGIVLLSIGDRPRAVAHFQKAIVLEPDDLDYYNEFARALIELGRLDEAFTLYERALQIDSEHTITRHNFVVMLRKHDMLERGLPQLQKLADEHDKSEFRDAKAGPTVGDLVNTFERLKKFDQAEPWRRKWVSSVKKKSGADSASYVGHLGALGKNLLQQQKWQSAEEVLREYLTLREKKWSNSWLRYDAMSLLGEALLGQKKFADAGPLLLDGYGGMQQRVSKMNPKYHGRLTESARRVVQFYVVTEKKDEIQKWQGILDRHEGTKVGGVHDVGAGLKLHGKLDDPIASLVYEVKLIGGKSYSIDMISADQKALDPLLVLQFADGRHIAEDDDGGGELNACIVFKAPRDGVYRVRATSFGAGRGEFTLTVREISTEREVATVHSVGKGLTLEGKIDVQATTLVYQVTLNAGKTYVIDMISPNQQALDPYLVLRDPDSKVLAEDDDGGDDLNARIIIRAPRDGVYRILATSYNAGRGPFTLTVREKN
jgi:serine/threonine protein kinase/Flp pilus assembly protein TadD